jgi:hypothetical protein
MFKAKDGPGTRGTLRGQLVTQVAVANMVGR